MRSGRAYWRLFVAGMRQQAAYRLATLAGLVANLTFGILKVAILSATVTASGGQVGGYDAAAMSTYVWLSQGMLGSINLWGRLDLMARIKDGSVTSDFLRPIGLLGSTLSTETGRAVFSLLPRGLPSVAIGALLVGISLPDDPAAYIVGTASLLAAIMLSATCVYLIAISGFWLVETRGLQTLYMVLSGFLAGLFVPLGVFPDWLQVLAYATPFPSMLMTPVNILGGLVTGPAALRAFGIQLLWLALAGGLALWLTARGRRHLEIQGG